jgi:hypothetical protein
MAFAGPVATGWMLRSGMEPIVTTAAQFGRNKSDKESKGVIEIDRDIKTVLLDY